uniref:AP2/ERF domain-containing protein n=1 Tax=Leersia perrieri TaxID=77586 RepID=A0A0D9XJ34_9ORYZ
MDHQWRCLATTAATASTSGNSSTNLPPLPMTLGAGVEYGHLVHGAVHGAEQKSSSPAAAAAMFLGAADAGWHYSLLTPAQAAAFHHRLLRRPAPCAMKRCGGVAARLYRGVRQRHWGKWASTTTTTGSSPSNRAAAAAETMQQLDFTEAPWDEADGFALRRYPSWEIDWDAILS